MKTNGFPFGKWPRAEAGGGDCREQIVPRTMAIPLLSMVLYLPSALPQAHAR